MKFSILGDDPDVMPLVRAVVKSTDHTLTTAAFTGDIGSQLLEAAPSIRLVESWEDLLGDAETEAVIVCGSNPGVLEGAKQIAAGRIPLMLVPHADQGAEFAYELLLVHDDTGVLLVPAFPLGVKPEFQRLHRAIADGQLGRVLFLKMDRGITTSTQVITNAATDIELLHDADLLRRMGQASNDGRDDSAEDSRVDVDQVTALVSGNTEQGFSTATVTLAGARVPEATWIVNATDPSTSGYSTRTRWNLEIKGEKRTAKLSGSDREHEFSLEFVPPLADSAEAAAASDRGTIDFINEFALAASGDRDANVPKWNDLIRVFEILDARHRSIRRRRTIDLYYETTSERSQFKTHMTAIGCGVMTLTLFGLVFYLVIASIADLPEWLLHIARVIWLLPLLIFITLQLLYFITRPSAKTDDHSPAESQAE